MFVTSGCGKFVIANGKCEGELYSVYVHYDINVTLYLESDGYGTQVTLKYDGNVTRNSFVSGQAVDRFDGTIAAEEPYYLMDSCLTDLTFWVILDDNITIGYGYLFDRNTIVNKIFALYEMNRQGVPEDFPCKLTQIFSSTIKAGQSLTLITGKLNIATIVMLKINVHP